MLDIYFFSDDALFSFATAFFTLEMTRSAAGRAIEATLLSSQARRAIGQKAGNENIEHFDSDTRGFDYGHFISSYIIISHEELSFFDIIFASLMRASCVSTYASD